MLSDNSIVSRRQAEKLIIEKRVTVNGHPAIIGQDVNPSRDVIHIDGQKVEFKRRIDRYYIMLNKPRGYVTTMSDEQGRKCVADLVKDLPAKVYPVGRLDKDSEGLLLLTNDGAFANFVMHPKHHISKTYRATIRPDATEQQIIDLSTGVTLDDGTETQPAQVSVEVNDPGRTVLRITIYEGKNRQVRRMCEAVGLEVVRLRRVSVGPVKLGMLAPGKWRELTSVEVSAVRNAIKVSPENEPKSPKSRTLTRHLNKR